mmetsp:Transcript_21654/g.51491  ORF Transcript_21654/g.51491 Transcript_21654/m.51491 type:complete len:252 (-) Transcript_21654:427-1182(-)
MPIKAEDVRRVSRESRNLIGGDVVDRGETSVFCWVVVGPQGGLVDDDIRFGQEAREGCITSRDVTPHRLRAVSVGGKGAPSRGHSRQGNHLGTRVRDELGLVGRVGDCVCGSTVHKYHLRLRPVVLGAGIGAELVPDGFERIVVRLDLLEDMLSLRFLVVEEGHELDPLGTAEAAGVEGDQEGDILRGVAAPTCAGGVREHHVRAACPVGPLGVGRPIRKARWDMGFGIADLQQLHAGRRDCAYVDQVDRL